MLGWEQPECYQLPMGSLEGFSIMKAFLYQVESHQHIALGFSSFHYWEWTTFPISSLINLWGWLMGSGSSSFNWGWDRDWLAGGWARLLGVAPAVWVGQHWALS